MFPYDFPRGLKPRDVESRDHYRARARRLLFLLCDYYIIRSFLLS